MGAGGEEVTSGEPRFNCRSQRGVVASGQGGKRGGASMASAARRYGKNFDQSYPIITAPSRFWPRGRLTRAGTGKMMHKKIFLNRFLGRYFNVTQMDSL